LHTTNNSFLNFSPLSAEMPTLFGYKEILALKLDVDSYRKWDMSPALP